MDLDSDGDGKFERLMGVERRICYSLGREGRATRRQHSSGDMLHALIAIPIHRFRYVILKIGFIESLDKLYRKHAEVLKSFTLPSTWVSGMFVHFVFIIMQWIV